LCAPLNKKSRKKAIELHTENILALILHIVKIWLFRTSCRVLIKHAGENSYLHFPIFWTSRCVHWKRGGIFCLFLAFSTFTFIFNGLPHSARFYYIPLEGFWWVGVGKNWEICPFCYLLNFKVSQLVMRGKISIHSGTIIL
jgi:hypothetical protein